MTRAAVLTLLLASACAAEHGPMMAPFQDCLACHSPGGGARTWTAAGTWRRGAQVTIVDSNGKTVGLRGNDAGNFYTAESLTLPIRVWVDGVQMPKQGTPPQDLSYGGCNLCHHAESVTVGPLMAPGTDCLTCHGPGGMATAKFSAAGTWGSAAGLPVQVGGYTTTTNAAGNFIFCAAGNPCTWNGITYGTVAPITISPSTTTTTRIGTEGMSNCDYGGCNRCHGRRGSANDG